MFLERDAIGHDLIGAKPFLGSSNSSHGGITRRFGGGERGLGMFEFFLANRAGHHQRGPRIEIALGFIGIGLRAFQFGAAHGNVGREGFVTGIDATHLAQGARQFGLGLLQDDFRIGAIELYK